MTFLFYAPTDSQRNSAGYNTFIAAGASSTAAIAAAIAAAPNDAGTVQFPGSVGGFNNYLAVNLQVSTDLATPIFVQGNVASPLLRARGY